MPIVQAYQCPQTSKLFSIDQKTQYQKHLRKVATERYNTRKAEQLVREQDAYLDASLWQCGTFTDIEDWFMNNGLWLARNAIIHNSWSDKRQYYRRKVIPLQFKSFQLKLHYSSNIHNTHSAPKGKPRNWNRDPNLPSGYAGWSGRLEYKLEKEHLDGGSTMFKTTGVYTGIGGGGGYGYGYDVILWEDDWPSLSFMQKLTENG